MTVQVAVEPLTVAAVYASSYQSLIVYVERFSEKAVKSTPQRTAPPLGRAVFRVMVMTNSIVPVVAGVETSGVAVLSG